MQWFGLVAVSLPGLAALAALLFTWMQVGQTSKELRISEQGQITNRFNAAITNLGSQSMDVRLGGIYALQRIMQDSSRDHPTVVAVLSAYVRQHARLPANGTRKAQTASTANSLPADVQAVMNVLANRLPSRDRGTMIDLSGTDLRGLQSMGGSFLSARGLNINFREANFEEADLSGAELVDADLREAWMLGAQLPAANLLRANLREATLDTANLTGATFCLGVITGSRVKHDCADLTGASLNSANLTDVDLEGAKLAEASMTNANLTGAVLAGADLKGADLTGANLTGADFTEARLKGAKLKGAKRDGVRGLPPPLR
ncbi:pentapeptide repeat-containing protein [Streptomyces sp. NPDC016172]|uniref:pentapeptide repeat-containing protein n=1 Tax=Streptomyces sp. NPDC016172 TaxID=3364964 RepID=UPI0036F5E2C5